MAKREDSLSNMVQVAPNEMIARRGNETDAQVRARYERQRRLEARESSARAELDRLDNRPRGGPVEEFLPDFLMRYPARRRVQRATEELRAVRGYKAGGTVKTKGAASNRGDGIAQRGKTKGRFV